MMMMRMTYQHTPHTGRAEMGPTRHGLRMGFMQASFYCPGRAQEIRTGPPMAPLSIGFTHLTLLGGAAHACAVYLCQEWTTPGVNSWGNRRRGSPYELMRKELNALRSSMFHTRLQARAVVAQERHAGRRAAQAEREHTENSARLAARFYFYFGGKHFVVRRCRSRPRQAVTAYRLGVATDTRRRKQIYKDAISSPGRDELPGARTGGGG